MLISVPTMMFLWSVMLLSALVHAQCERYGLDMGGIFFVFVYSDAVVYASYPPIWRYRHGFC